MIRSENCLPSLQRMLRHGRTCLEHYKTPQQCAENALACMARRRATLVDTQIICLSSADMHASAVPRMNHCTCVLSHANINRQNESQFISFRGGGGGGGGGWC